MVAHNRGSVTAQASNKNVVTLRKPQKMAESARAHAAVIVSTGNQQNKHLCIFRDAIAEGQPGDERPGLVFLPGFSKVDEHGQSLVRHLHIIVY